MTTEDEIWKAVELVRVLPNVLVSINSPGICMTDEFNREEFFEAVYAVDEEDGEG